MRFAVVFEFEFEFTVLAVILGVVLVASAKEEVGQQHRQQRYHRYPHYPEYCSTPQQMDPARAIPALPDNDARNSRLVHVTAILRHGATTIRQGPSEMNNKNYHCWDDYWTNPETGVWDCPLKSLYMPPSPERVEEEEGVVSASAGGNGDGGEDDGHPMLDSLIAQSMFLFTKDYDALQAPQGNVLNGTCELGQLISQGYEQQVKNGQFLRDAYLYEEGGGLYDASDTRLQLFQVGGNENPEPWTVESQLYVRSDDSQATLMSAQLLMRGLFEKELIRSRAEKSQNYDAMESLVLAEAFPTIKVHTADHSRDILGGFREHCEALIELQAASDQSWEYKHFTDSAEAQSVQGFLGRHLHNEGSLLDCLMTTVCTDRPLPDRFGIYNPHPNSWFNRIASYYAKNHSYHLNYNDAEFSKLSAGPLWAEIMDHIDPVLAKEEMPETHDRPRSPAKLAIYSGYDSTIMEVLASLGAWAVGNEWPPYASMVLLEIHEFLDEELDQLSSIYETPFAFRLLYNGQVLTDKVEGCTTGKALCDARHLVNRVEAFAHRNVDCISVNLERNKIHPLQVAKTLATTTGGILLILLIIAFSALVGSIAVFYHLTGSVPTEELNSIKRQVRGTRGSADGAAAAVVVDVVDDDDLVLSEDNDDLPYIS